MSLICPQAKTCTLASSCFHSEPHEPVKLPMMDERCDELAEVPCEKHACVPVEETNENVG